MASVLITGADRGLGSALTACAARAGFHVYRGLFFEPASAEALPEDLAGRVEAVQLDITDAASIGAALDPVRAAGQLDLLINNAGVCLDKEVPLEALDCATVRASFEVNAIGPLLLVQQALPLLRAGTLRRIVNISSEAGSLGACQREAWFGYCMSKAALNMQSILLRNRLAREGFTVLALHPGWMRTAMSAGDPAPLAPAEAAATLWETALHATAPDGHLFLERDGSPLPY